MVPSASNMQILIVKARMMGRVLPGDLLPVPCKRRYRDEYSAETALQQWSLTPTHEETTRISGLNVQRMRRNGVCCIPMIHAPHVGWGSRTGVASTRRADGIDALSSSVGLVPLGDVSACSEMREQNRPSPRNRPLRRCMLQASFLGYSLARRANSTTAP
jgi:hypothetical protein